MNRSPLLFAMAVLAIVTAPAHGSLVINEIMHNSSGPNDGIDNASGEWVELFNNGLANFDASGHILSDGDWTIVFPASTIIAPGQFFLVGFAAFAEDLNGATIDLDVGALAASLRGGPAMGLTNGGEHLGLYDSAGLLLDGVIWGTPSAANTPGAGDLTAPLPTGHPLGATLTIPAAGNFTTTAGGNAGQGQSIMRTIDGAGNWVVNPGGVGASSAGLPNAAAVPEPSSLLLLGSALTIGWTVRTRRRVGQRRANQAG